MGSYSAPTFALGYYKALNDNTADADEILVGPVRCANWEFVAKKSALYDGIVDLDLQLDDDTWVTLRSDIDEGIDTEVYLPDQIIQAAFSRAYKFPYYVRLRVDTPPTVGVSTVYLITDPAPANPLF